MDYASRPVEIGFGIKQNVEESTVSVASASNDEFNKRSSKNIGNSLLSGSVLGLTAFRVLATTLLMSLPSMCVVCKA